MSRRCCYFKEELDEQDEERKRGRGEDTAIVGIGGGGLKKAGGNAADAKSQWHMGENTRDQQRMSTRSVFDKSDWGGKGEESGDHVVGGAPGPSESSGMDKFIFKLCFLELSRCVG